MITYLALGSNIGDREQYLRSALRGLSNCGVELVRSAGIYSTEPREVLDQPWFLNTVIEGQTTLAASRLLEACLQVEEDNLRTRDTQKGPRTLDIDIIFYGDQIIRKPGLVVPHPRFADRRFVLVPLAEIAAGRVDPGSGRTIADLLASCTDTAVVRQVGQPLLL